MPFETWTMAFRSFSSSNSPSYSTTEHFSTNFSFDKKTWSGTHSRLSHNDTSNPISHCVTWTYGDGDYNRPFSISTNWFIKF